MTHIQKLLHASAAVAVLCLAACSTPAVNGPEAGFDPARTHPIGVEPQMMTLRLPYDGRSQLDQNANGQLARFASDYLEHGSGAIAISAPNRLGDAPEDIADRLVGLGVAREHILVGNQDDPRADGVKLTYIRYVAKAPVCGDFSVSLTDTSSNLATPNLGCATQHNIAAMVSDPRDLVSPHDLTPDDAQRRLQVLDKYRKGETTVSEKTQQQSGAVSQIGSM